MKYLLSILTFCSVLFLGLNSSFANYQAGSLTAKQQAIIPIASYTATGDLNNLKIAFFIAIPPWKILYKNTIAYLQVKVP